MILTPTDVAGFLGISPDSEGLVDAIEQSEALVAAKLGLDTLDYRVRNESRIVTFGKQQIVANHGPIQHLDTFTADDDDELANVEVFNRWAIRWVGNYGYFRTRSFGRLSSLAYSYGTGWTNTDGDYPLPIQVKAYVQALTGLVYQNLLASGVYDTKLGDMTIKIQRETLKENLEVYEHALRMHARPF